MPVEDDLFEKLRVELRRGSLILAVLGALRVERYGYTLRQSLEAYREVIERASATQERSARLVQAALESFATTTQAQLELTRAFLVPLGRQPEAFGSLVQGWNDAFLRLLEAAPGAQPRRRPERE